MSNVYCPKCNAGNNIDRWNSSTRDYERYNGGNGEYGRTSGSFVVCPNCDRQIDIGDFSRAIDDAND